MGDLFEFKLADGRAGSMKRLEIHLGLCKQLGWAMNKLGVECPATDALLAELGAPVGGAGAWPMRWEENMGDLEDPTSRLNKAVHNWLLARGLGTYATASQPLQAAGRLRFGARALPHWMENFVGEMIQNQAKALGHGELEPEEVQWKDGSPSGLLAVELPVGNSSQTSFEGQDRSDIDARVEWARKICALWPAAAKEWAGAGLACEPNPLRAPVKALEGAGWAKVDADPLEGELWVAVGTRPGGALTFLSANGTPVDFMPQARTFGDKEQALEWARRHGGAGAISASWSLSGFAPAFSGASVPDRVGQVLSQREAREIASQAGAAPSKRPGAL